ncbi:SDR family oxidoreductase [Aquabacterium sp. CECT 9606]|uniref:SDR family oxidoreductase n=1 Tax=Aquabacterium sp. CECT 9606 TaxID=2845822 RepID=UPI001E629B91|nr:SDR family oxidoreductase [Aquabacterium sp. CECT 9606]CAH0348197.1 3-phenylpropionate-dihydrodiol/cinnamic acid-dihydrodiol dehydrogenase [Aquabacterium sp. CECT 9606]
MKIQANEVVLITGCGSGIGKALARAFHGQGFTVCATARRVDAMSDLERDGIQTLALDVTQDEDIKRVLSTLKLAGQQVGALVNNAGYGAMGPLLNVPSKEWQRQFDVNVFAPMALTRAVLPGMIDRGRGTVVNISSVSGVMPTPFAGAYCASKAALNAASDALRMELRPLGIDVVTVQPGGIQSSFGDRAADQVNLARDSPYQAVRQGVLSRANESQEQAMPAAAFADALVHQLKQPRPPAVIRLGKKSTLMPLLKQMLPTALLDSILSKRFQLNRLSPRKDR